MRRSQIWNIIFAAILLLQFVAEGLTIAIIWRLDVLPAKYNIAVIAVFILLGLMTGLLLFLHGKGRKVGTVRRVIACVLALAVACGCAAASAVASSVYDTMHEITKQPETGETRTVYVRADDPATTLQAAADYKYGIVDNFDAVSTQQAIAGIESTLGKKIDVTGCATVFSMVDGLYANELDAIILNSAYTAILEEEGYTDFYEKTKVLCEVTVEGWSKPAAPADPEKPTGPSKPSIPGETEVTQPQVDRTVTNAPFILYISGSDTRYSYLPKTSLSDVNILAVVDPVNKRVLLLNTPRDYYVPNPAGNGIRDKLTHCGSSGVECSIQALEDLYGITIDYNARINFNGFKTLIDAIGGVEVYSSVEFVRFNVHIKKGMNYLNGEEALVFARERYQMPNGDNDRGKNQMKVIKAVIEKATSGTTIISNYSGILNSMKGVFSTSFEMDEISQLVKMQLNDMASWNIQSYAVSGTGGRDFTYSYPGTKLYVTYVDDEQVDHAAYLIGKVMAGQALTEDDLDGPN